MSLQLFIVVLAALVLVIASYGAARIISHFIDRQIGLAEGFIGLVIAQHVIAIPVLATHGAFRLYYYPALFITTVLFLFGAQHLLGWISVARNKYLKKRRLPPISKTTIIAIAAVGFAIILSQAYSRYDFDDSFNTSLIQANIDSDELYKTDPTTGNDRFGISPFYRFMSWELFLSTITKATTLPTNIVAHTLIPLALIPLAYSVYHRLFLALFKGNQKRAAVATTALVYWHIAVSFSRFAPGLFLLASSWRGKSVLVGLLLPLFTLLLVEYAASSKPNGRKNLLLLMTLLSTGATALNPSSIFLVLLLLFSFGLYILIRERSLKASVPLVLPTIPLLVLGTMIAGRSSEFIDTKTKIAEQIVDLDRWTLITSNYYGGNAWAILALVLITCGVLLSKKKLLHKHIIWPMVITFLVVINPLVSQYVGEYLTSAATYWRLYWLLPVGILFSSIISLSFSGKKRSLVVTAALFIGVFWIYHPSENWLFLRDRGFEPSQNLEKVPNNYPEVASYIIERGGGITAGNEFVSVYARSFSDSIELTWSRRLYMRSYIDIESQEFKEREAMFSLLNNHQWEFDGAREYYTNLFKSYDVRWLWLDHEDLKAIEKTLPENRKTTILGDQAIVELSQ